MRILSITEGLYMGGDEQRLLRFAGAIRATGHDHRVIVLGSRRHEDVALDPDFARAGIDVTYLGWPDRGFAIDGKRLLSPLRSALALPGRLRELVALIRAARPDVLDLRKHYPMLVGGLAGRIAGVPAITGIDYHPGLVSGGTRRALAGLTMRLSDAFVSDVRATIDGYVRVFPALAGRSHVIHNGVPDPADRASPQAIRAHFGLDDRPDLPLVAQVATLVPFKGQHVLLDAIGRLVADGFDAQFIICGFSRSPDYVADLRARVVAMGLAGRVGIGPYPGPTEDIWTVADLHVHASLMDSAPAAIHESMAAGLALVSTDVGGIAEIVRDGETALLVPPNDAEALARQVARLLRDPALRQRMGQAARRRHEAMFSIEAMTARTLALYDTLLSARTPALELKAA